MYVSLKEKEISVWEANCRVEILLITYILSIDLKLEQKKIKKIITSCLVISFCKSVFISLLTKLNTTISQSIEAKSMK